MNVSSQLIFVFLSYKSLPALLLDCSAGVVSLSSGLLFRLFLLLMGRPQACALLVEILLSTPIHIPLGASRQAQTSSILGSPSLSHMLAFIFFCSLELTAYNIHFFKPLSAHSVVGPFFDSILRRLRLYV